MRFSVHCFLGVFFSCKLVNACESLAKLAQSFPPSTGNFAQGSDKNFLNSLSDFTSEWDRNRQFFRMVVGHSEEKQITDALDELVARYYSNDDSGYRSARRKLISSIEIIIFEESLSIDSIF